MPIRARNHEEIEKRGAFLAQYGDYIIYKCANCGEFALYNNEYLQIHLNPDDLSSCQLYGIEDREKTGKYDVVCPSCNAVNTFDEAPDKDSTHVSASPWAFVLK